MTTREFSNEFDILYNNIMSNQAPGLNEYEKSVLLTKAQYELVKNYFNPLSNKFREGLDDSEKRQIDFSLLIKVIKPEEFTDGNYIKFDDRSYLYALPDDIMFIINETAVCDNKNISIIPISFEEYTRLNSKPYREPFKRHGWRLVNSIRGYNSISEIIVKTNTTLTNYKVRYVKKPKPIILDDLTSYNVSIEGINTITECELPSYLHQEILQRAVELAKSSYIGDLNSTINLGNRTE